MSTSELRKGRSPKNKLFVQLALALCVGAGAILLLVGGWNMRLQREHMTRLVRSSAERTAELIRRSTRQAMMLNNPRHLQDILQAAGEQEGITSVRVFDKAGLILSSSNPEEVGCIADTAQERCLKCHEKPPPVGFKGCQDRVSVFDDDLSGEVMSVIAPIHNEPDCSTAGCHAHDPKQRVLGVLALQLSLAPIEEHLRASERQMVVGNLLTVGAVLLMAGFLIWRMVLRPVSKISRATGRVATGDLDARVEVGTNNELGALAGSWNTMVGELSRARSDLESWSHTLEDRVEEQRARLEDAHQKGLVTEKLASLGKLAASVAHEINNPLAGIGTYAKLLNRRLKRTGSIHGTSGTNGDDASTALELIESESARCGRIVQNLLLFSRTRGAAFAIEDLQAVFDRCELLLKHKAEMQNVEVVLDIPERLPEVECDAAQIQQVVLALGINAIDAMPDGGTLTFRVRAPEGGIQIVVLDTGLGISPENQGRIFEPFFTTKEEGVGVGLGLAVVYGVVRRHGGTIKVESQLGAGTAFRMYLPRRQSDPAGSPSDGEKVTS